MMKHIMSEVQEDQFKVVKWYFTFLGLWPTQSLFRKRIGLFMFIFGTTSLIIPQVLY